MTNSYHAHVQIEYCFEFTGTAAEIDAVFFVDFQSELDWLGVTAGTKRVLLCFVYSGTIIFIFFL
mgnify:CR=1 FL=1